MSSSSTVIYDKPIWNPLDLLSFFLDGASSAERFGVFCISAAFVLAQLGTNIAGTYIPPSIRSRPSSVHPDLHKRPH